MDELQSKGSQLSTSDGPKQAIKHQLYMYIYIQQENNNIETIYQVSIYTCIQSGNEFVANVDLRSIGSILTRILRLQPDTDSAEFLTDQVGREETNGQYLKD